MQITRTIEVKTSPRLLQVLGIFDIAPTTTWSRTWDVDLDLPEKWNVGVIVGKSGDGKTTIFRELFGDCLVEDWPWPADRSIVDAFPAAMPVTEIVELLNSVGFSSPPDWVKPYHVLSNGQKFRVTLARTLAELPARAGVDEFGSFVQADVRKICASAVAKTVRRRNQQFIAVTCHADCLDWFEPDWVYDVATSTHTNYSSSSATSLAASTGHAQRSLQRPDITLKIIRSTPAAWSRFKHHHYLSGQIHRSAACYVGLINGQPAAFTAVLSFPHPKKPGWREHRTVCLPDFQGVGIGNAMSEYVASLYAATGKPYTSTTSHPAMIRHRRRSKLWRMIRRPGLGGSHCGGTTGMAKQSASARITAGFEYVGPTRKTEAQAFGVLYNHPNEPCPQPLAVSQSLLP